MNQTISLKRAMGATILCLGGILPVAAQDGESRARAASALTVFLTWLPLLLFLGIMAFFYGYLRKAAQRARRHDEHMERVEQLLERVARALEGNTCA